MHMTEKEPSLFPELDPEVLQKTPKPFELPEPIAPAEKKPRVVDCPVCKDYGFCKQCDRGRNAIVEHNDRIAP